MLPKVLQDIIYNMIIRDKFKDVLNEYMDRIDTPFCYEEITYYCVGCGGISTICVTKRSDLTSFFFCSDCY